MRACRLLGLGGQATHSDFAGKTADERLLAIVGLDARLLLVEFDRFVAEQRDKPAGARGERGGVWLAGWSRARYSMTRSRSLREARRAGLCAIEPASGVRRADAAARARGWTKAHLNTTISAFCVRRKQAQKMAMLRSQDPVLVGAGAGTNTRQESACLKVFPKRRGVLISTSPGHDSQPCFCMMAGFCTPQSSRYMTRADALKKFSWNSGRRAGASENSGVQGPCVRKLRPKYRADGHFSQNRVRPPSSAVPSACGSWCRPRIRRAAAACRGGRPRSQLF